jgi:hypothetical protein
MSRPAIVLSRIAAAGFLAAAMVLASCSGSDVDQPPDLAGGASAPLDLDCLSSSQSVLAGSSPILVFGRVTRGNVPIPGATVVFTSSRGLVQPQEALTDAEGMATAQFTPPGTPGDALLNIQVTDRRLGDTASSSCQIAVVDPGNPRLNVQLIVPDLAAGLEVTVQYDPSRVDLPAGSSRAAGAFAGPNCIALSNDNGFGIVELNMACSAMQGPTGTVATFDFVHLSGPEVQAGDFTVACAAFDEQGRALAAACTSSVTQL